MAQIYSPRVVTDGLVMHFDASLNKSYPDSDLPVKDGLGLWLDAADDMTFSYSSGTAVSQWRDKSGNNFHASQGTVASQPSRSTFQNSRKTVNFDGTNDTVTIPNFRCNSEMSIFIVSNCGSSLLIEHSTDANSNQGFYFYGGGNGMIYITRSTGTLIWNANWLSGGYSVASAVNSTGLDLLTYKNGTQQTITTDNRSAVANSYVTNTLYIGSRGANSLWSSGPIAEIIIYNKKVTNKERNLIHTYLGQKWGIVNSDRTIFDLSGNGYDALFGNGSTADMPLLNYYNQGGLKFNGKYALCPVSTVNSLNGNALTVEAWIKHDTFGGAGTGRSYVSNWSSFNVSNQRGFILRTYDTQTYPSFWWCWGGGNYYAEGPSSYVMQVGQIYHVVATYEKNVGMKIYINGNLEHTTTNYTSNTILFDTSNGTHIGYSPINTSYMDGNIYVAKLYNRALLASEVKQNYEAQKSRFANTIVETGLVLNLDAGNPFSYAGAGTTWFDVSGNSNNGTLTNGPTYNSTNGGVVVLDGVDDYVTCANSTSLQITSALTLEIWFYNTATVDGLGMIVKGPLSSDYDYMLYLSGNSTIAYFYKKDSLGNPHYGGVALSLLNRWLHIVVTHTSGGLYTMYVNGLAVDSATFTNSSIRSSSNPLYIGAGWNPDYFYGNVGETRIYNVALSATQVLQNYNATKGRYGL